MAKAGIGKPHANNNRVETVERDNPREGEGAARMEESHETQTSGRPAHPLQFREATHGARWTDSGAKRRQ